MVTRAATAIIAMRHISSTGFMYALFLVGCPSRAAHRLLISADALVTWLIFADHLWACNVRFGIGC